MRRARIKAVANVQAVRRKIDDNKNKNEESTTKNETNEDEKPVTSAIPAEEDDEESKIDKTENLKIEKNSRCRIRAVAKIPTRRNKNTGEELTSKTDDTVTEVIVTSKNETNFIKPSDENNDTLNTSTEISRPSPVTSPLITHHRPRIRSTPRLDGHHHRRNSASASESEDEYSRRVNIRNRYDSISNLSADVSLSTVPSTPQKSTVVDEESNKKFEDQINRNILSPTKNNVSNKELLKSEGGVSLNAAQPQSIKRKVRRSDIAKKMAEAKRDFYNKFGTKTPDRQKLTMMDLIFYNPTSNPMLNTTSTTNKKPKKFDVDSIDSESTRDSMTLTLCDSVDVDEPDEDTSSLQPVPQVKIGENGEIILDEQSVIIETTDQQRINKSRELTETAINYDELNTTYGIYKRAKRTKDWSLHETKQFYRVLQMIGTDFSMMLSYFKNRTRRDLKLKFKKEEKINRHLIDKVLLNPCTFDLNQLQQALDKDVEQLNQQKCNKEHLMELKRDEVQKRKRKYGEKRVRYKTGSWFARQMYADKSEMIQAHDEDDPDEPDQSMNSVNEQIGKNNTINTQAIIEEMINNNIEEDKEPSSKKCKFLIDELHNVEDDAEEDTNKLVTSMFGNKKTTRCGRKIRPKILLENQQEEVTENVNSEEQTNEVNKRMNYEICEELINTEVILKNSAVRIPVIVSEDERENVLLKNENVTTDNIEENIRIMMMGNEEEHVDLLKVKEKCTTNLINNNHNKLNKILENYLGHNKSIILELPVVNTECATNNNTECLTTSDTGELLTDRT